MNDNAAYTLFVFKQAPYANILAHEGYDALFAYAAFDQPVKVLFWGAGTLQLIANQQAALTKSVEKLLLAFEMYDIPMPFLHQASCQKWLSHNPTLVLPSEQLNNAQCRELIGHAKSVHTF